MDGVRSRLHTDNRSTSHNKLSSMGLSSLDEINKRSRGLGCGAHRADRGGSLVPWVGAHCLRLPGPGFCM